MPHTLRERKRHGLRWRGPWIYREKGLPGGEFSLSSFNLIHSFNDTSKKNHLMFFLAINVFNVMGTLPLRLWEKK